MTEVRYLPADPFGPASLPEQHPRACRDRGGQPSGRGGPHRSPSMHRPEGRGHTKRYADEIQAELMDLRQAIAAA